LQKQVEDQKAKFLQLSELVGEVLNVEQATGEDDADVIEFELQSVGKQMLQRLDHRFFAGYSQRQLDQLVSRGEVHPNTMLKTDGTGNMRTVAYISSRPLDCRELRFVRCLGDRLAHGKNVRASALRKFCSKLGGMLLSHEVLSVVVLLGLELRAPKRWQPSAPAASHDAARRKRTRLRAWVPSLHRTW